MERCDVLIVGGGPAGSTCAGELRRAGLDILLLDRQTFPRDKPCAGWITPEVLTALEIDREEYQRERVLQPISGFRTGLIHGPDLVTRYGRTVSFGIRRREFDHYLLQRSGVRQLTGEPAAALERKDGGWLVNGRIMARLLVGAGGHFCPVARLLGAQINREDAIVAQAAEFLLEPDQERSCSVPADTPAIFFCRDMRGYGWLFRKGKYLNVGLGRMDRVDLARHTRDFCGFLEQRGDLPAGAVGRLRGHAYLLSRQKGGRRTVDDGVLLVGDAAGLSHPQSGEGILPAVESALLAADTILAAKGDYRRGALEPYAARLSSRPGSVDLPASPLASMLLRFIGARLLSSRWFVRHIVLDRWFLHT